MGGRVATIYSSKAMLQARKLPPPSFRKHSRHLSHLSPIRRAAQHQVQSTPAVQCISFSLYCEKGPRGPVEGRRPVVWTVGSFEPAGAKLVALEGKVPALLYGQGRESFLTEQWELGFLLCLYVWQQCGARGARHRPHSTILGIMATLRHMRRSARLLAESCLKWTWMGGARRGFITVSQPALDAILRHAWSVRA
jgi:hypothetical protein